MRTSIRPCTFLLLAIALMASTAMAASATPPPGATWVSDLEAAQQAALADGEPIFLYFTKTY